jgi:hypothetical protein
MSDITIDQAEIDQLDASGLFDAAWYLTQYPDVGDVVDTSPLMHFYLYGSGEGRKPNRYFDPAWYLHHYPDVRAVGMNPLLHYLRHGDGEGRRPVWHFDSGWYRTAYEIPRDANTLAHFLTQRSSGRFAPMPELWSVLYLERYQDDPALGDDPFEHYLDDMLRDNREVFPDMSIVKSSGLIDPNYYLINGADVHEAKLDPAEHFCRYGYREARKPNIYFDMQWYLRTNPLVERLKINPVTHYILEGEMAGRRPVAYFDPAWYRETYAVPAGQNALAHFLANRRSQKFSPTPLFDVAWYVEQHKEEVGGSRDPFAHFLQAGTHRDINPSPGFDSAAYRRRHLGRPSRRFRQLMHPERDNPLVHYLKAQYR